MNDKLTAMVDSAVQKYTNNGRITSRETRNPFKVFGNAMNMDTRRHAAQFVIDNLITGLTPCEFVTLTAIQNRTVLYGKYAECIPQKHILNGLGAERYEEPNGYPISRKSLSNCLQSLTKKNRIICYKSKDFDKWPKFYGINFMYTKEKGILALECFTAFWEAVMRHGVVPSITPLLKENLSDEYRKYLGNELSKIKRSSAVPDIVEEGYFLRTLFSE